jgi:hypothetical protein
VDNIKVDITEYVGKVFNIFISLRLGTGKFGTRRKTLNFAMSFYPNLTTTIAYGVSYQICGFFGTE